jgi:hypothetical protein
VLPWARMRDMTSERLDLEKTSAMRGVVGWAADP